VVLFTFMRNLLIRKRRERVASKVVSNGQAVRELRKQRNSAWLTVDMDALDQLIERGERKQREYLEFLKNTA
jgi:hypothetical protein